MNAGVSIRLGKRSPESRSRVAMGREIAELNARLQDMENKYNNLLQILTPHAIDPSKTAEFPDVPRNHWAYQYISQSLAMVSLLATLMAHSKAMLR